VAILLFRSPAVTWGGALLQEQGLSLTLGLRVPVGRGTATGWSDPLGGGTTKVSLQVGEPHRRAGSPPVVLPQPERHGVRARKLGPRDDGPLTPHDPSDRGGA